MPAPPARPSPAAPSRGAPWILCALLVSAAGLLIFDLRELDRPVMQALGDAQGFPLRQHPLLLALHTGGRWLSALALLLTVAVCLPPRRNGRPGGAGGLDGPERLLWLSGLVLGLVLVPGLKQLSLSSCPWSLAEFGGKAAWISHWAWEQADGGPGHCFPSGHAAGAFAHLSAVWAWSERRPRRAWALFGLVMGAGLVFGLTQTLRGAHAPSHSLWSAWLCAALGWGWRQGGRALLDRWATQRLEKLRPRSDAAPLPR